MYLQAQRESGDGCLVMEPISRSQQLRASQCRPGQCVINAFGEFSSTTTQHLKLYFSPITSPPTHRHLGVPSICIIRKHTAAITHINVSHNKGKPPIRGPAHLKLPEGTVIGGHECLPDEGHLRGKGRGWGTGPLFLPRFIVLHRVVHPTGT
ncbi:hypothetical protein BDN67DRAFT_962709 [Paxillus ammoniavirescens]|nr:hypothetical protein BDN67DRAFT_962709 [Paxillus ammoniavirescens]